MMRKRFRTPGTILGMLLGGIAGWTGATGNYIGLIVTVTAASILFYLAMKYVREINQDERSALIYEKAAGATLKFVMPLLICASIVLFILRESLTVGMYSSGFMLAYTACAVLLVHLACYLYYVRKY